VKTMHRKIALSLVLLLTVSACGPRVDRVGTSVAATLTALPQPTQAPTQPLPTLPPPTNTPEPGIPQEPPTPTPLTPGAILGQHTVQPGETLFCIGRAYGVHPTAIAEANRLDPNAPLTPGQALQIPAAPWAEVAPGPVCAAQFQSPFPGLPFVTYTPGPAPTLASGPEARGVEAILILEPGAGSAVTSAAHVAGEANPAFEQSLVVQISDAEGKFLSTTAVQIAAEAGQRGPFSADVPFHVLSDQPGRISVYAASARDGGLTHLASVEVTLLAAGSPSLRAGQPHPEQIAIFAPTLLATLSGGVARITGFSDYVFESQLGVAICGEGGSGEPDFICGTKDNALGMGTAFVNSPDAGQPGPFAAEVKYTVQAQTPGRVVVFDASPRDGGVTHLASVEVTLRP